MSAMVVSDGKCSRSILDSTTSQVGQNATSSAITILTRLVLANTLFFNIGARLARMTGNGTYADYASKTWEWLEASELINNKTWAVYDGAKTTQNCSEINKIQFSAGPASLAMGAAFMYNFVSFVLHMLRVEVLTLHACRPMDRTSGRSALRTSPRRL